MFDKVTIEEIHLMCIYDTSSREALLADLHTGLADVYEPEMREIFGSAISKLHSSTDEEFAEIGVYLAEEYAAEEV